MADLTNAALNVMLTALQGVAVWGSLHSADPGATGTSELAGGAPAYARKAITWAPPSGGTADTSALATFDVPAGSTAAYWGLWSAVSGGTFYGSGKMTTPETYGAQGKCALLTGTTALG